MMKFKNQLKRAMALSVTLTMCSGMLQTTALAEDWDVSTPSGGNVTVSGDADKDTSTEWKGSSSSTSEDGNTSVSVTVDGSREVSDPTPGPATDTGRVEGTETITSSTTDEESGRVTQESGTTTDSQVIETTETETTTTTETITETETTLGDRDQIDVKKGDNLESKETEIPTSSEAFKDDLQVSFGVKPGEKLDSANLTEGNGVVVKDTLSQDEIKAELKSMKNEADASKTRKEDELKKDYKKNEAEDCWEKVISDQDGKETGKEVVKVEVKPITDEKDTTKIIGYQTITTTTHITYGTEYKEISDTTVDQTFTWSDPSVTPSTGDQVTVEFDRNYTSTVVAGTVPEGATAITDAEGNTIGYTVVTTIETTDPVTGVTTTETRNEDVYFQVTETEVTGKTQQVDKTVSNFDAEISGKVTETRDDTVEVNTTTEESKLDISEDRLSVTMEMDKVLRTDTEFDRNGYTINDGSGEINSWDNDTVMNVVQQFQDKFFEEEIKESCIQGASINVVQKTCDSNGYEGKVTLNFKFTESQLSKGFFTLSVSDGNSTKKYAFGKQDNELSLGEEKLVLTRNSDGTQSFELGNVGSSMNLKIQLVGKMTLGSYAVDEEQDNVGIDQYFNYETKVEVTIKEAKAEIQKKQTVKDEKRIDTLKFERNKTISGIQTETVTTTTDVTTTQTTNNWVTNRNSSYTYASAPVTPILPGGGTGTTTGDTVTVADGPTPLAETPEVEVPETEVPLAETPVEEVVEITDEAVPMADVPAEVVIVDDAVPLADVPKTGDISGLWYATAVLSLGGWMLVRGKKNEEDA